MAVSIRLKMLGTKNRPAYRIIAVDGRKSRDGESLANLGHYNPLPQPAEITIDEPAIMEYLNQGAQPTVTVRNLLRQKGIKMVQESKDGKVRTYWTKSA
jgi:small subunit ribosomal protein S16